MNPLDRSAPSLQAPAQADSTTRLPRHGLPWGTGPDDAWLARLAAGCPLLTSEAQDDALRRLPDALVGMREMMGNACTGGLALDDRVPQSREQSADLRHLLALTPAGLLPARHRDLATDFRARFASARPAGLSFGDLHDLLDLMNHLRSMFDRVVPGGARHEPDVLRGLALLRRWERSDHGWMTADRREHVADLLHLAALVDPAIDASVFLLDHWPRAAPGRDGDLAPDLPDAEILRRLHLTAGQVEVRLEGQSPMDWRDLRDKAEAGGIVLRE